MPVASGLRNDVAKIGLGWLNIAELEHFTLLRKDIAADVGTLDELAAKGIHYVIVHGENRAAYAGARNAPSADIREQFEQRRKFYSDLASQAKVVWKQKSGEVANLLPDIRVYQITPLKPQP